MALLDIHVLGSPVLRQETVPVTEITDDVRTLVRDMFETMYAAKGIGLAAPQVGRLERLAVIDVDDQPMTIINPEIVAREGRSKGEEGCLSIPDVFGDVERPARVVVRAMDLEGRTFEIEAKDLLARCLQHEIDHLHGRLFLDYLGAFKRRSAMAQWEKERVKYGSYIRKLTANEVGERHVEGESL
jgi:peptide deformylase